MRGQHYNALNPRQQKFVDGILAGKPIVHAALEAGYAARSAQQQGSTLVRNPKVRRALAEARDPDIASADEVQRFLTSAVRGRHVQLPQDAEPPFVPLVEGTTDCPHCQMPVPVPVKPADRIKAAEVLMKSQGVFVQKLEHSGALQVEARMGPDVRPWPLELAEAYRDLAARFAAEEAQLVERAKAVMAERGEA